MHDYNRALIIFVLFIIYVYNLQSISQMTTSLHRAKVGYSQYQCNDNNDNLMFQFFFGCTILSPEQENVIENNLMSF